MSANKIFEGKRIVKAREQLASVELTAQQVKSSTVWLVREPGWIAGEEKLNGWFLEIQGSDIVLCVTTLFKGEVTSERWFPPSPVFKWKKEYQSRDKEVASEEAYKKVIVARMADENLLGYYDMLTPATPLVNRLSASFKWWKTGGNAPIIPFSPTNSKSEIVGRIAHFETAFAALNNNPPFALDGLLALRVLKDQLPNMKDRGAQNVSRFLTTLVKAWAMSKQPSHFKGPLSKISYPTEKEGLPADRAKIFHNLICGKGDEITRGLGFCLWAPPRITVTTDAEGFTSKQRKKHEEKKIMLDIGPDIKVGAALDAEPLEGSFAESSAAGASRSHMKKNSDPEANVLKESGPKPDNVQEEVVDEAADWLKNSFTMVNFRRFYRRVKRSVTTIKESVTYEGVGINRPFMEKAKNTVVFTVTSAVKACATVPIAAAMGVWYGVKEPFVSIKDFPTPSGKVEMAKHVADCAVYSVTSVVTSTISGIFAGLASATR
ncbi:hypothetical protein [Alternaria brassicicola fusarivirus 1]|uniref:Uncharacterized protein n=1 Tax=Alternaria brassicicola fusarivirus 1 TaxID=1766767 RepID=A0A0U3KCR3_9VIRU|nr:hypothetical protein AXH27_gp3 [Alternaria brassicicola fusarivirus 1]ALW95412.1 hypothetical protein [Alternaria brassicicola fusarivirus 1]